MLESSIKQPPGFSNMSKVDQVRHLQALWDQIAQHPDELPVPVSHLELAEKRLKRHRASPSEASPAF